MEKLIFDAGPLITACRFTVRGQAVIDHILQICEITIADSVHDEVVVVGQRYSDAQIAAQRVSQGSVHVQSPPEDHALKTIIQIYGLGRGEQDSILMTKHENRGDATLVVDGHLAYLVSDRLGVKKRFLLEVIADWATNGSISVELARTIVEAIRSRYPKAFVEHTLLLL